MKKLSFLATLVFAFVMIAPTALASAQEGTNLADQAPDLRVLTTDVRPDIHPTDRCVVLQERIETVIENTQKRVANKKEKYEQIKQKVRRIIAIAEEHGVDASVLVEDLKILDQKIERLSVEVREFVAILKQAHELACGDDRHAYQDAVQKARQQLRVVRKAAADVRVFIVETLIPDARKVLAQI